MRLRSIVSGVLSLGMFAAGSTAVLGAAKTDPTPAAVRRAVEDLGKTYPQTYTRAGEFLKQLDEIEAKLTRGDKAAMDQLKALQKEALLANPLLDFGQLLLIRRGERNLGLPQNWQGNCSVPATGYDNEVAVLPSVRQGGPLTTLYKPEAGRFVGDINLNFDADRMLVSMPDAKNRWHVWELSADGKKIRQVTPDLPEAHSYNGCYLPDGKIIFDSSACFHGVPCVGGSDAVANLFRMDADGKNLRQLTFDQDHDWYPTVLNDGRVLYTRWEYSDSPHYFTRLLFRMNPDGTGQAEYYGSNSYWPNSTFYAKPIPGHRSAVVGIISGHHGVTRMGELIIFDPERGSHESSGVVQRIPGYGKPVEPVIADGLVEGSWPKFLHPFPLSDKYFIVSCKPAADQPWGLWLVDIFDNFVPILQMPGQALFEPVPFRKTVRPPVIPDRIKPESKDATVYIADIYMGPGLKDVPRGTVKKLRVSEIHYAYNQMGGHINVGIDGPWDVHRIVGTVPVQADGSASFKVPANTPLSLQPLDEKGRAVQVMRSWFTAMPGEAVSCIGCHEKQNTMPPARTTLAQASAAAEIAPWYGPARGFSFKREVQPVLDRFCVGCHDGKNKMLPNYADTTRGWMDAFPAPGQPWDVKPRGDKFTASYVALHPFVRRPGPESDYHLPNAMEYHASTSWLVQMLEKGHHGVKLDAEAWDRLYTWIDLNVPDHGTWGEQRAIPGKFHDLRLQMRTLYANRPEDPETIVNPYKQGTIAYQAPPAPEEAVKWQMPKVDGWPFDETEAKKRQVAAGLPATISLDLGENQKLEMMLVPAGSFVMGDAIGYADERPLGAVKIDRPFYMGRYELTNGQFKLFDPSHDSGVYSEMNKDHSNRGHAANRDRQPVVRANWQQALAYTQWLSQKTGKRFSLPTEAQWEWACRAGTATPLWFGGLDADFSKVANLADIRLQGLVHGDSPKWFPAAMNIDDGATVTEDVGRWKPNAWGLHNMHGNAAEWTLSTFKPYPYADGDGRNAVTPDGMKVARGGSFNTRPMQARSAFRQAYPSWQKVFDVGFRVIMLPDPPATAANR
ncbi:MAG: SUMF1/EgtB/PvdO family nonheme iron enzyme [Tepidisphaerales bacterium]